VKTGNLEQVLPVSISRSFCFGLLISQGFFLIHCLGSCKPVEKMLEAKQDNDLVCSLFISVSLNLGFLIQPPKIRELHVLLEWGKTITNSVFGLWSFNSLFYF